MFKQFLERYGAPLDAEMRATVDDFPHLPTDFGTMLRYPMGWVNADGTPYGGTTGKRIRPVLLLLCAEATGGDWQRALPAAAAVEWLHNFSLVHDDIQDNSDTRHSRATVWRVWGQPMAINVGDAMFALAYHAMHRLRQQDYPAETLLDVWTIFNRTIVDLTRGQYMDMHFETDTVVTVDEYLTMVDGKTAALLACVAQVGALLGSQDATIAQNYADFGRNLGLAFQIRDDILGIWGTPEKTGKSAATDIVSRKKSVPVLYGLANSQHLPDLYAATDSSDAHTARIVTELDAINARGYAEDLEVTYYKTAMQALDKAQPTGDASVMLTKLVDTLFGRVY